MTTHTLELIVWKCYSVCSFCLQQTEFAATTRVAAFALQKTSPYQPKTLW